MTFSRGFNPVGDHAPGPPDHTKPPPGHVPSQDTHMPIGDSSAHMQGSAGPTFAHYVDPGFPRAFGIWSGRLIMVCAIAVTLPIQVGLYPIAGAIGVAAGALVYLALHGFLGHGVSLEYTWPACFWTFLPAMRMEIAVENRVRAYRAVRQWLRPVIIAAFIYLVLRYVEHDAPDVAAPPAVVTSIIVFFVVRMQWASALWHQLQEWLWLRKP